MSEPNFIYSTEVDLSLETGYGINEREFVRASDCPVVGCPRIGTLVAILKPSVIGRNLVIVPGWDTSTDRSRCDRKRGSARP